MIRKLTSAVVIGGAREDREQDLVGRQPDAEAETEIAIVGRENVLTAIEGHRRAGLQRFVALAAERERNLALAVELKAAIVELALQQHVAKDRTQLLVAESVALETSSCNIGASHRRSPQSSLSAPRLPALGIDPVVEIERRGIGHRFRTVSGVVRFFEDGTF